MDREAAARLLAPATWSSYRLAPAAATTPDCTVAQDRRPRLLPAFPPIPRHRVPSEHPHTPPAALSSSCLSRIASSATLLWMVSHNMPPAAKPDPPPQNGDPNAHLPPINHHVKPKDEVVVTDTVKAQRIRNSDRKIINQYEFIDCLGRGQHGQVWVAANVTTQHKVVRAPPPSITIERVLRDPLHVRFN